MSQDNLTRIMGVWMDQQNDSPTPRRSFNKQDAQAIMQSSLSLWTEYNLFEQRRHLRHSLGEAAFFAIPFATIFVTIALLWGGWVRRVAGVLAIVFILVSTSPRAAGFLGTMFIPGSHAFLDDYVFLDDVDLRNPRGAIAAYDWRGPAQGWPYVVAFDDGRVEILYDVQAKPLFEQQGIPYPTP